MTTIEAVATTRAHSYLYRLDDEATRDAMWALGRFLDEVGYGDLYAIGTKGDLYARSSGEALTSIETLGPRDRAIVSFFGFGLPQPLQHIDQSMGRVIELLGLCDLLSTTDIANVASTKDYVVVPALGGYLLVGMPPLYQSSNAIGATAYLGRDSLILANALPPLSHKRVLDLGAGCGIQGLLASRGAAEAVLTDLDEASLELAACNQLLNSTAHPIRFLYGDGYEPVFDERFDLIVTLAPYVPSVPDSGTSRTVAGGDDGLQLLRRFAGDAFHHLAVGGEFVALAQLLCNDNGPLFAEELDDLAPDLDSRLILSDWHPLQPYILALCSTLTDHGAEIPRKELIERYTASLRGLGATGVCTAIIRLRRPPIAGRSRRRELIGKVPAIRRSDIPSLGQNTISGDRSLTWITSTDGGIFPCNGPTSALLQVTDGFKNIAAIAEQAWGPFKEQSRLDLEDQAIARLAELERAGLISFTAVKESTEAMDGDVSRSRININ